MIKKFEMFNESLNPKQRFDKLHKDIIDTFAYISDDNTVIITPKKIEINVEVKTPSPANISYNDLSEYIEKNKIWQEILEDIDICVKRLVGDDVGSSISINTVGNVKINFHVITNKLYDIENNTIFISKSVLLKSLNNPEVKDFFLYDSSLNNELGINLRTLEDEQNISKEDKEKLYKSIIDFFNKNGLHNIEMGKNENRIYLTFYEPTKNSFKQIKLQNVV